jgi:hypothetical protein
MDDRDLRQAITFAKDAAEIADFLCRDVEEVRAWAISGRATRRRLIVFVI